MASTFVPPDALAQGHVVEVRAAGRSDVVTVIESDLRAFGGRAGIDVRWEARESIDAREVLAERPPAGEVLARVWLDLGDPERAVLFIANGSNDRFLVRVVPITDAYGEMSRESLATIVESLVEALLAGGEIGVDRSAAAREIETVVGPIAPPPPEGVVEPPVEVVPVLEAEPPVEPSPAVLPSVVSLRYRLDLVAEGPAVRHGPELAFSWTDVGDAALAFLLAGVVRDDLPYALGDAARAVEIHGGGLRVLSGLSGSVDEVFVWQVAVGGGVDVAGVTPRFAAETGLVATDPFVLVVPIASAIAGAALRPARWIELTLGAGIDIDFAGHHFDVQSGPSSVVLAAPWVLHPFAFLGVGLPLAGSVGP